jgi:maltose alpha-D-glucosyltransferase/alpha-amylase
VALETGRLRPEDVAVLSPWCRFWQRWVSAVFLKAYLETAGEGPLLPSSDWDRSVLLDYYLLKRAASDLRYELSCRINRVPVRVQELLQRLETPA